MSPGNAHAYPMAPAALRLVRGDGPLPLPIRRPGLDRHRAALQTALLPTLDGRWGLACATVHRDHTAGSVRATYGDAVMSLMIRRLLSAPAYGAMPASGAAALWRRLTTLESAPYHPWSVSLLIGLDLEETLPRTAVLAAMAWSHDAAPDTVQTADGTPIVIGMPLQRVTSHPDIMAPGVHRVVDITPQHVVAVATTPVTERGRGVRLIPRHTANEWRDARVLSVLDGAVADDVSMVVISDAWHGVGVLLRDAPRVQDPDR